jgi:hypothetical protein
VSTGTADLPGEADLRQDDFWADAARGIEHRLGLLLGGLRRYSPCSALAQHPIRRDRQWRSSSRMQLL